MGTRCAGSHALAAAIGGLLLSAAAASPAGAEEARFLLLGDLPGGLHYSQGFAVTHDGSEIRAAGGSDSAAGLEVFRFGETAGLENLGELAGGPVSGEARGISGDGTRVVGFSESASGREAFLWTEGVGMVGLGDLPGGSVASRAWAISPDGSLIVGEATTAAGLEAVRWTEAGGFESLGDLPGGAVASQAFALTPDGSVIVGVGTGVGLEAFRWTAAGGMVGLGVLPGATLHSSRAKGVSPDGEVVVGFSSAPAGFEAFRWTSVGGMESLGDLPGGSVFAQANSVTADGKLAVGLSSTGNTALPFTFEAMLWTERDGMRRLADVLELDYGLDLGDWLPWEALSVTPDGHLIIGIAIHAVTGVREAFVAELPVTACHDGSDDDGDGFIDQDDPACSSLADDTEDDACQNGIDDDGDGGVDFDGGASIHGAAVAGPDPQCGATPWRRTESKHCGLGFELVPALVALLWVRRRPPAAGALR